jgi:CRP/FNR family cyclic AMP-dependent transcriptional regulator
MSSKLDTGEDPLDKIMSAYPVRTIQKGRPLLYQGEIPTMGFYVKEGIVKLYNITNQGEEKIVGYESAGGLLPIEWLFGRAQVALYYYDTFTDCEVIRVPKDELVDKLNTEPESARALLDRSISMYIGATMHLHALEQSKARQKLLSIFQYLVLRFGKKTNGPNYRIDLKLTHQEIANLIGTTRETTSTEISKLSKEGVLEIIDALYVVNTDKAVRLLGEDDFNQLKL